MVYSQLRSTRPCITICLVLPDSGRSFLRSTEIWHRRPVVAHVRAADACTPPTISGSRGALPPGYPKHNASDLASAAITMAQEESNAAVATLLRSKGLSRRHRHPHQHHAAGAVTTPSPGTFHTLLRRRMYHRLLVGLLARTFPATPFWKRRAPGWCRSSSSLLSPAPS